MLCWCDECRQWRCWRLIWAEAWLRALRARMCTCERESGRVGLYLVMADQERIAKGVAEMGLG